VSVVVEDETIVRVVLERGVNDFELLKFLVLVDGVVENANDDGLWRLSSATVLVEVNVPAARIDLLVAAATMVLFNAKRNIAFLNEKIVKVIILF